jgi:hypothetical protein
MDKRLDEVNYELLKTAIGLSFWDFILFLDLIIFTAWKMLRSKAHNACARNGTIAADDDDVFT